MSQTTRIGLAVIATTAVAAYFWLKPNIPDEFSAYSDSLKACDIDATFNWPDPDMASTHAVSVALSGEDHAEIQVPTRGATVRWDGRSLRVMASDIEFPVMDMTERSQDLMAEICSGLSNSKWKLIDPPVMGLIRPAPNASWVEITLPFDWVDFDVLIAIDPNTHAMKYLLLQQLGAPFVVTANMPRGQQKVRLSTQNWVGLGVSDWRASH